MSDYDLWYYRAGDTLREHRCFSVGNNASDADRIKEQLEHDILVQDIYGAVHCGKSPQRELFIYKRRPREGTYCLLVNGKAVRTRYNVDDITKCYNYYVAWFSKMQFKVRISSVMYDTSSQRNYAIDEEFFARYMRPPIDLDDAPVPDDMALYNDMAPYDNMSNVLMLPFDIEGFVMGDDVDESVVDESVVDESVVVESVVDESVVVESVPDIEELTADELANLPNELTLDEILQNTEEEMAIIDRILNAKN